MNFSEPTFLFLFLPLLLLCYFCSRGPARNLVLTIGSLIFYAVGEWRFLPLLIGSIALNYWIALALDRTRRTRWARPLLVFGITSDLALLLVFKYAGFFVENANSLLSLLALGQLPVPHVVLPLGISFFTFHKISYKVDVYRGEAEVRKNALDLALYILIFPQLVAGPIIRYHEIADQIVRRTVSGTDFSEGIRRFILGLAKKMIIANTVALPADRIFGASVDLLTTPVAWLGILCYTLQIYFDFSGYSDMAIGLGRMFGFRFLENFDHPYVARSVTEFWRRWHISLSRWFRDYLYIPLGGNRCSPARSYVNLVIVFLLCGFWHGANWTFIVWGAFHGLFLVCEKVALLRRLERVPAWVRSVYTLAVVMVGWVFFRADNMGHAVGYLGALVGNAQGTGFEQNLALYMNSELGLALLAGVLAATPIRQWLRDSIAGQRLKLAGLPGLAFDLATTSLSLVALGLVFLLSAASMAAGTYNPFIYFRF